MRRAARGACALAAGLMVAATPSIAWAADGTTTTTQPTSTTTTVAAGSTGSPASTTTTTTPTTTSSSTTTSTTSTTSTTTLADESPANEGGPTTTQPAEEGPGTSVSDARASTEGAGAAQSSPAPPEGAYQTAVEQQVTITITDPVDGATVPPGEPVEVEGTVTIGLLGTGVSVAYVVDTSGSTSGDAGDCNGDGVEDADDDLNGDGAQGEIIDCEIAAVKTLENQLAGINGDIESGLVSFDSSETLETGFGQPGRAELDDAVSALNAGGGTDFNDALAGMNQLFDQATTGNRKIGYLFTDGEDSVSTGPGTPLQSAIDAGIVVNTFSVGVGAVGCEPSSPLTTIADATGGECIEIEDPADIIAVLEGLRPAGIEKVEVSLNGGPPVAASVDLLGNFEATVTGIVVGPNEIVATVTTDDQQTASDRITVNGVDPTPGPDVQADTAQGVAPAAQRPLTQAASPASGTLPATGGDSFPLVRVGTVLLLAGAALALVGTTLVRRAG